MTAFHITAVGPHDLIEEIESGIKNYAVTNHGYAYEVDGLGNSLSMDDANMPSLLSLPYLGVCSADDEMYLKTRERILSDHNPYFHRSEIASEIGSQHTPPEHIWPIAIAMEGLTRGGKSDLSDVINLLMGPLKLCVL